MADLSITANSVVADPEEATIDFGIAGASITAGQALYKDTADSNKLKLLDANDGVAKAVCAGVALNPAASGQPVAFVTAGRMTIGATTVVGEWYCASVNAGGIAAIGDLSTGEYSSRIGYSDVVGELVVDIKNTGVARG